MLSRSASSNPLAEYEEIGKDITMLDFHSETNIFLS